jgi:sortase A
VVRPFFILAALGAGLLFIQYQEAAAPTPPVQASSAQAELPAEPGISTPAQLAPANSAGDWPSTASSRAANPVAIAADPAEPPDQSTIERLVIPDLQVDAKVVSKPRKDNTWDITGLRADVAWLEGTAHPASTGNTVLAGHIMVRNVGKGPFRYLDRLKEGAIVLLYTGKNRFVYQVSEQFVVKETDGEVTFSTSEPQLTLLTCSNWDDNVETYQRRRVVVAGLVKVEPLPVSGFLKLDDNR